MTTATDEKMVEGMPRCENCGDLTPRRFYKDCSKCDKDLAVCEDCLQDHVEVAHEDCGIDWSV